jgi:lipopolysaccharide transport system permease protein
LQSASSTIEVLIKPRLGWQPIDLRELWEYRELLGFLMWRDIKVRYKQTVLGGLWAVLQPLIGTLVFGILFTTVAPIRNPGAPYGLFVYAGLLCWTFFANGLALSSNSVIGSEAMIRKTYLPRILLPLGSILALGLDILIGLVLMGILLLCYRYPLTPAVLTLPIFILCSFAAASGMGLILSAWNVRYRDVKYIVPFFTQMAFFLTPVLYPIRSAPHKLGMLLFLNPMAGAVEGFRHALLGTAISWTLVETSAALSFGLLLMGLFVFRRMERTFADTI